MSNWDADAREFTLAVVRRGETFTANDLWEAGLEEPPSHRRVLGKVLLDLEAAGRLHRTGRRARSVGGHGGLVLEWRRVR